MPIGQVQFLVNGKAILAPQPLDPFAPPAIDAQLPAGTYRFTAQYMPPQSPGPDFTSSSGSVTEVVAVPTYTPPPPATSTAPPPSTSGGTVPDSSFFLGEPVVAGDGTIVLSAQSRQAGRFSYSAKRVRGRGPVIYGTGGRTSNGRESCVTRHPADRERAQCAGEVRNDDVASDGDVHVRPRWKSETDRAHRHGSSPRHEGKE